MTRIRALAAALSAVFWTVALLVMLGGFWSGVGVGLVGLWVYVFLGER